MRIQALWNWLSQRGTGAAPTPELAYEAKSIVQGTWDLSDRLKRALAEVVANVPDSSERKEYTEIREGPLFLYALGLQMMFASLGKNRPQHELDALANAVAADFAKTGRSSVTPALVSQARSRVDQSVGNAVTSEQAGGTTASFDAFMLHMTESFPGTLSLLQRHAALGYEIFRQFGSLSLEASGMIPGAGPTKAHPPGPMRDATDAVSRGDYATALGLLRPLAEQGDVDAQLGLAILYSNGEGVPQNHALAMLWNRRAADQGDARAQFQVGAIYLAGKGVVQDAAAAVSWFRRAAEQGYFSAQFNLGVSYLNGTGVQQDLVEAHKWFSLGAAQGDAEAARGCEMAAARMTAAQIAEAERLAGEWKAQKEQTARS